MPTPSKVDYDKVSGEALIHDPVDGHRYEISNLKGKFQERPWEEHGVSWKTVVEQGGYKTKEGKWRPVYRGYICSEFAVETGRGTKGRPKSLKGKGGVQMADPAPRAKNDGLIETLNSDETVVRAIRKHINGARKLENDLELIPFFLEGDGVEENRKGMNNIHAAKMHPHARLVSAMARSRQRIYDDEDAKPADKLKADKLLLDAYNSASNRVDGTFKTSFDAMTKMDKIKEAALRADSIDGAGKKMSQEEKEKKLKLAAELGIPEDAIAAEFQVVKDG